MRIRKTKIKKAIELLKGRGIVLSSEQVDQALNGQPVVNEADHAKFDEWCQHAWAHKEPFVVNFNPTNEHPIFHRYDAYRNLRRHIASVHRNGHNGSKKIIIKIKRKKKDPVIGG